MASLKPTARKFAETSFDRLEAKVAEKKAEPFGPPTWQRTGGELFVLQPKTLSPEEWCLIDEEPHLSELPESHALDAALRRDSRISPLLGELVGTPLMSALMDEQGLKRDLLWSVMREGDHSLRFSEEAFTSGYEAWLAGAVARTHESVALAPLTLQFDGHLELAGGVAITQLDDDEVSACLYMGAIRPALPMHSGSAWVRNRAAIRTTYKLERGPTAGFSAEEPARAMAIEAGAAARADEVVDALRVFKRGRVAVTGYVTLRGGGAMMGAGSGPPRVVESEELALTAAESDSFETFWPLFRLAWEQPVLGAVIRRFSYAGERTRSDDEIVDLVASLEALLLSDIDRGAELTFRTALRGALFIDGSGLTRAEVKKQLIRGYGVRSAVAHGGEPRAGDLKAPNGDPLTLEAFVDGIEELARLAVRKAIEAVGAGATWPPDWDALTLEGATYPST